MTEPEQDLFGRYVEEWRNHWRGMPAFTQETLKPWRSLTVHFETAEQAEHFERHVSALYHDKWCWYPPKGYGKWRDQQWVGGPQQTRYPVYVISKGRAESRLTARTLERAGIPYSIVVEPQETAVYEAETGSDGPGGRVLTLPFRDLGEGSIPARNWVWDHAEASGYRRHWIMDDNIDGLYRLHENTKRLVRSAATLCAAEDFVDRYTNVALAGFHYESLVTRREACPPYRLNRRCYSCILVNHDLPHRWRGRYNEDTDLSLRALKDGWCTVLFNAFLANKCATMRMAGGNTDELYSPEDGRLLMAESLREQHPDVTTVTWKWGRWQHHVDYSGFRPNQLQPLDGVQIGGPVSVNEYGMRLEQRDTVSA